MLIYLLSLFSYQYLADATSITGLYQKVRKPVTMGLVNVTFMKVKSRIQCSQTCLLRNCLCFSYDKSQGECAIGNCLSPNINTSITREFFVSCNYNEGFKLLTSGSVTACMWVSNSTNDYTNARNDCIARSAQLYTVKTIDKLNILQNKIPLNQNYWVGLNDITVENTFRWEDDNTICNSTCRVQMFFKGEPNNKFGIEDCVIYADRWLNDVSCSYTNILYICEKNFSLS